MNVGVLKYSFTGPDGWAIWRWLRARGLPRATPPSEILLAGVEVTEAEVEAVAASGDRQVEASISWRKPPQSWWLSHDFGHLRIFGTGGQTTGGPGDGIVKVDLGEHEVTNTSELPFLRAMPFLVAFSGAIHPEWMSGGCADVLPGVRRKYRGPNPGQGHWPMGWLAALKGAGHTRLASARILDHSPFLVIRTDPDLTVVLFHDAEASPCNALVQAMPGHQALFDGLWLPGTEYTVAFDGRWNAQTRTLTMVVLGREVPTQEILEARGMVLDGRLIEGQPVERVRYLFMDDAAARAHLHAMWLREVEVWTFLDGEEVRLDADYVPPPYEPPEWVERVRTRDGL